MAFIIAKTTTSTKLQCPLKHQNEVTKVCLNPQCNSSRLTCEQCYLQQSHKNHQSEDLSVWIKHYQNINQTKDKQLLKMSREARESIKTVNNIKQYLVSELLSLQKQIKYSFQHYYKEIETQYSKINVAVKKIGTNSNASQLNQIIKTILKAQRQIEQPIGISTDIHRSVTEMFQQIKQEYEESQRLVKNFIGKYKIKQSNNFEQLPKKHSNQIVNSLEKTSIRKSQLISNISESKQKSTKNVFVIFPNQIKNNNGSNSFSVINPMASLLIPNLGFDYSIKFQWSNVLKGNFIQSLGTIAQRNINQGCNNAIVLSNNPLSNKDKSFWKIKLKSCTGWIAFGICSRKIIQQKKFSFIATNLIGHGCYALSTTGLKFSHSDKQQNNIRVLPQFNKTGTIISSMFDPANYILTFRLQNPKSEIISLNVPEPEEQDDYYAFTFIFYPNNKVQLL